jgi:hypothetical protein
MRNGVSFKIIDYSLQRFPRGSNISADISKHKKHAWGNFGSGEERQYKTKSHGFISLGRKDYLARVNKYTAMGPADKPVSI